MALWSLPPQDQDLRSGPNGLLTGVVRAGPEPSVKSPCKAVKILDAQPGQHLLQPPARSAASSESLASTEARSRGGT